MTEMAPSGAFFIAKRQVPEMPEIIGRTIDVAFKVSNYINNLTIVNSCVTDVTERMFPPINCHGADTDMEGLDLFSLEIGGMVAGGLIMAGWRWWRTPQGTRTDQPVYDVKRLGRVRRKPMTKDQFILEALKGKRRWPRQHGEGSTDVASLEKYRKARS